MKLFHLVFSILLVVGAYFLAQNSIKNLKEEAIVQASEQLALTRDIRIAQLNNEVKTIYSEVRFWAESKPLRQGMESMLIAWKELSANPNKRARQLYVTENPLYPNYTADFLKADDGSAYSDSHQSIHTLIKDLTKRRGYYDVFLIANNGDVIYSVFKEDDYATNLNTGKYKDTALAKGFREVQESTNLNHVALTDFLSYKPSHGVSSSFIQTSITDQKNKTIGVLAFQLPIDSLDKIISNQSGLAKGTEIIAVGEDFLQRNRVDKKPLIKIIKSEAVELGLGEKKGVKK